MYKKHKPVRKVQKQQVVKAPAPKPGVPLPTDPPFSEVMRTHRDLMHHLRTCGHKYFGVGIDVVENQWVFIARMETDPGFRYWDGYKVFWARSKIVRNK